MTEPLERVAAALERMAPAPLEAPDFESAEAFLWHVAPDRLEPVKKISRVDLSLLLGIDRARDILLENTRQFARGFPANNALLWGARGMGKSSLVKAVHGAIHREGLGLKIVELQREDLPSVIRLLALLRGSEKRFCSFVMISPSAMMISITNRSKRFSMAVLRGARRMCCFTRPQIVAISCRAI